MINGESYFSKKYVVLSFRSGCRKDNGVKDEVYEITKKEHQQKFTDAVNTISSQSYEQENYIHLDDSYVLNRGNCLLV